MTAQIFAIAAMLSCLWYMWVVEKQMKWLNERIGLLRAFHVAVQHKNLVDIEHAKVISSAAIIVDNDREKRNERGQA